MVYAMRSNLRNTIDDILSSGLANSFQIPDTITDWKTRTQANAFGNSTWLLYQSTKTAGVSAGNITSINNSFSSSNGLYLGRIIGTLDDDVTNEISGGKLLFNLQTASSVSNQANLLGYTTYPFTSFYGTLNGDFDSTLENCVKTIEVCPDNIFTTAIGYINDLTTSCLGGWAGLGYASLNNAVAVLTGLLAPEVTNIAALTTNIVGDENVTGTTIKDALEGSNTSALALFAQYVIESTNKANMLNLSQAFSIATSIQNIGSDGNNPTFKILATSLSGPAKSLFYTAPNIHLANSTLAPQANESLDDTFYRVSNELTIPTPSYNPIDVIMKAAAVDNAIYSKYLNPSEFDPNNSDHLVNVLDNISHDMGIDPCGGNRQLRLKYLRDHLDNTEIGLLKDRIKDVRDMLTD